MRGIDSLCDKEALRLIQSMPKWIPGEVEDGSKVCVRYTIPINFILLPSSVDSFKLIDAHDTVATAYKPPQYPGGHKAMQKFIEEKVDSLYEKYRWHDQDRVIVGFTVETDGNLTHLNIMRSNTSIFDDLALEVVKSMPKWKPGELEDGTIVPVKFVVPILFKLR